MTEEDGDGGGEEAGVARRRHCCGDELAGCRRGEEINRWDLALALAGERLIDGARGVKCEFGSQ